MQRFTRKILAFGNWTRNQINPKVDCPLIELKSTRFQYKLMCDPDLYRSAIPSEEGNFSTTMDALEAMEMDLYDSRKRERSRVVAVEGGYSHRSRPRQASSIGFRLREDRGLL
ncbi:unnamed protein product [Arctia plantaginis]|uniref:Uncharacterized protein n=1 Tax=Arctia plantaginis TaxID=874455 RepID=A0A8S1AXS5_ARCPL|nr:unnamed protein product [Arctia plantaginis]